jgi:hypothetical protein
VWDSVRDSVWDSVGSQHDAWWLSFYSYFRDVCGLTAETDKLGGLFALAQSAGWALPHQKICWVSERHQVLSRDARGRLHCTTGPAVLYPDGWAIYAVNGVCVPSRVIESPESYTADEIRAEKNSEVTRVLAERLGWDKFLDKIGSVSIDKWTDPKTGLDYELLDSTHRIGELQPRLLKMRSPRLKDGSSPYYIEPVAPGLRTAQAARKWQCVSSSIDECNNRPEMNFGWEA